MYIKIYLLSNRKKINLVMIKSVCIFEYFCIYSNSNFAKAAIKYMIPNIFKKNLISAD